MKRSIKSMIGFTMHATDGEIGKVEEFYFDDRRWVVRYLIVKTGGWLSGRKVLISPQALQKPDWDNREFPTTLSKKQIRLSPDIDTDEPVSRQQEELLHQHYPWQGYYNGALVSNGVWGIMPDTEIAEEIKVAGINQLLHEDVHLRSTKHVAGYRIHAVDGEIGKVTDFIVNDEDWAIHFLVVNTGSWISPGKILLSTKWIKEVNWAHSTIVLDITLDRVKSSRPYDETHFIDTPYEQMIFDHYGRPIQEDKSALDVK